jgi:hypothetical protein
MRPFDGSLWEGGQKALLARKSNPGIPIGIHCIGRCKEVMMVEGAPDYLRVMGLLYELRKLEKILPLMMVSAAVQIYEGALSGFRLKRVRILAQNDECGLKAAARWKRQLLGAGADVDVWVAPNFSGWTPHQGY